MLFADGWEGRSGAQNLPSAIFGVVTGSIYCGIATPTVSAALGVTTALFFVWRGWRPVRALLMTCVVQSARTTGMSMLVLTVPIAVPVVAAMGIDPIWFGGFEVLMCEIALITPPMGMNLFVVQGVRKGGGDFGDVVWGSAPFVAIMIAFALALIAFPRSRRSCPRG